MTYQETVEYLYASAPLFQNVGGDAYKEGLANTLALDAHFGHPHTQYRTVHVAGTNGKGSCSHTLAAILQSSGLKVGLFTSPHLIDFRERIRVNGKMIEERYVVDFVERERDFFEPLHPSFFELTTALALKYFADEKVDIAVIEVGLGGRLDCTNIIHPVTSVITNISFDHVAFLGNTLAKIAGEKAGIIKRGVPAVVGEAVEETRGVFEAKAREVGCSITFAEDEPEVIEHCINSDGGIDYKTRSYGEVHGELGGFCQVKNTNTILTAVNVMRQAGLAITEENVSRGFARVCELTGLMGRWQTIGERPKVVCDTGHNVGGFEWISRQLRAVEGRKRMVFGMVNDKDVGGVLSLLPKDAQYYFCQASVKRALKSERMKELAEGHGLRGAAFATVAEAYGKALADAAETDFVYVGGSSFVVADLLSHLTQNSPKYVKKH